MNKHPLQNVVLNFELPFVLRVVDSIREETTPADYQQYVASVHGIPVMLRFEKKLRDLGGVRIATEDRLGMLNHSLVQVWFDEHFFERFGVQKDYRPHADNFIEYALEAVNRFIELYRHATNSFWIRRIKANEIPYVQLIGLDWDGNDDPFTKGTLGTGLGLGNLVTEDQDSLIRQGLMTEWVEDELKRFAYLADSLLDQEDFWGSTLAVEIYFEALFARWLRNAFTLRGLTEEEVDRKFDGREGFPRSITNLLKTYVRELVGVAVDDNGTTLGRAYQKWASDARDLRNDIAHGKKLEITKQQAVAAVDAVVGLRGELEKVFLPILRPAEPTEG